MEQDLAKLKANVPQRAKQKIPRHQIDPLDDVIFKVIFGKPERRELLVAFINDVLGLSGQDAILDLKYLNSEITPPYEQVKLVRLDLYCVTEKGAHIDVEVQLVDQHNMEKRALFYWSRMYSTSLEAGQNYHNLKPAITITILRYVIFSDEPCHTKLIIVSEDPDRRYRRYCHDFEQHFLQLPKFQKRPIRELGRVERWMAWFSKKLNQQELEDLTMETVAIRKALDAADLFLQNEKERVAYLNREIAQMDVEAEKQYYEDQIRQGRQEERLEIARNLKALGVNLSIIAKSSGLTPEEIEKL